MSNIEFKDNITFIHPLEKTDDISETSVVDCLKIAHMNAMNKQLFNNCCNINCGICNRTKSKAISNGSLNADIMFVCAYPSEYETYTGCFTDDKGYFLNELLTKADVKRSSVYCTSILKCNALESTNENIVNNCLNNYFKKELRIINPRKIIFTITALKVCIKYNIVIEDGNHLIYNNEQAKFCDDIGTKNIFIINELENSLSIQKGKSMLMSRIDEIFK